MITCQQFDDLLLEGDPASMASAARHAAECPSCADTLASWNDIAATAGTLHESWPSELLWPRIRRALLHDERPGRHLPAVAAALLLAVSLGAFAWFALQTRNERASFDRVLLREQALDDVERAEQSHLAAIERLEKTASPQLESPASPLMVSYREKLMLLDDAIHECQNGITQNRQNAHLRKQLLAVYSEKQRTLEDVLHEETLHVSNQ